MTAADPFVTEVAVQFKDFFKTADQQTLQVEFRSDTHEHIAVQGVVMGLERRSGCAAGDVLEHGGFHFHEPLGFQIIANLTNNGDTLLEQRLAVVIHDQVKVALPVPLFHIGQTVPFFRQGAQTLGKHGVGVGFEGDLAGFGSEKNTADRDNITNIQFFEALVFFFPQIFPLNIQLDLAGIVLQVSKGRFAHHTQTDKTTGDLEFFRIFHIRDVLGEDFCAGQETFHLDPVGLDPGFFQFLFLGKTLRKNVVLLLLFLCCFCSCGFIELFCTHDPFFLPYLFCGIYYKINYLLI